MGKCLQFRFIDNPTQNSSLWLSGTFLTWETFRFPFTEKIKFN